MWAPVQSEYFVPESDLIVIGTLDGVAEYSEEDMDDYHVGEWGLQKYPDMVKMVFAYYPH